MRNIPRFAILMAAGLSLTISLKLASGGRLNGPSEDVILSVVEKALEPQGFAAAGTIMIAGKKTLLVAKDSCLIYVMPVSPQGWHQETLRKYVNIDQKLSFVFNGQQFVDEQPRWPPLMSYYGGKALNYAGFNVDYNQVFGVVSSNQCDGEVIDWSKIPSFPFHGVL